MKTIFEIKRVFMSYIINEYKLNLANIITLRIIMKIAIQKKWTN